MKNLRTIPPVLVSLLLVSMALAQAGNPNLPDAPQPQNSDSAQSELAPASNARAASDGKLVSQARQHPRFPCRPVHHSGGQVYASRYSSPPGLSPVGALIGFGVGAGLGASASQDGSAGARVASGLIVGAIGAVIGGAIGAFPHVRRGYPPSEPDDEDDESDLRSDARSCNHGRSVPAKVAASSQSPTVQAAAPPASEGVAVPYPFKRVYGTPEP